MLIYLHCNITANYNYNRLQYTITVHCNYYRKFLHGMHHSVLQDANVSSIEIQDSILVFAPLDEVIAWHGLYRNIKLYFPEEN